MKDMTMKAVDGAFVGISQFCQQKGFIGGVGMVVAVPFAAIFLVFCQVIGMALYPFKILG